MADRPGRSDEPGSIRTPCPLHYPRWALPLLQFPSPALFTARRRIRKPTNLPSASTSDFSEIEDPSPARPASAAGECAGRDPGGAHPETSRRTAPASPPGPWPTHRHCQHVVQTPFVRQLSCRTGWDVPSLLRHTGTLLEQGLIDLPGARSAGEAAQLPIRLRRQTVTLPGGEASPTLGRCQRRNTLPPCFIRASHEKPSR